MQVKHIGTSRSRKPRPGFDRLLLGHRDHGRLAGDVGRYLVTLAVAPWPVSDMAGVAGVSGRVHESADGGAEAAVDDRGVLDGEMEDAHVADGGGGPARWVVCGCARAV